MTEEVTQNEVEDVAQAEQPEASEVHEALREDAPEAEAEQPEASEVHEALREDGPEAEQPSAEADDTPEAEQPSAEAEDAPTASKSISDLKTGMELKGVVKSIELYGAFIDVGIGKDALLHISQLGKPNVRNVEDIVKKGEEITVYVLKVEPSSGRIALSLEKPPENPISQLKVGDLVTGQVTRIENFGVFVEIGAERPGMIHVSELATEYVKSPEDVVKMGEEVQAKVIKVNRKKRQIDLSIKAIEEASNPSMTSTEILEDDGDPVPTAMELALRRALDEAQDDNAGASQQDKDKKVRNSQKKKDALQDVLSRTLKQHNN